MADNPPPACRSRAYRAWGRVHAGNHTVVRPTSLAAACRALEERDRPPALPFGLGRSYGDSCLNPDGILIDTTRLDRFIAFDSESGILEAEAGVSLAEILNVIVRPQADGGAWFLPVTPGTRYVTLGGAVANDVHGKNHHRRGSFGCHVQSLTLARSDGRVLAVDAARQPELFKATIGGLGLTGLILSVRLQMRRVPGLMLVNEDIRFGSLDEFYALSRESEAGWEYSVAWIDCLARGRGIFSRANHAPGPILDRRPAAPRLKVPLSPPISPLNPLSLRLFNALYWRRLGWRRQRLGLCPYPPALYPLDGIGAWNRLYGRRGFYQYQCALPEATASAAVAELLEAIAKDGQGSFLAVLKTMGTKSSPGLISFPMPGTTLALDFPNRGAVTLALLERLDRITIEAGGRLYPAKDGRMAGATFRAGYPAWQRFARSIDPGMSSAFWRRVMADAPAPIPRQTGVPAEAMAEADEWARL